MAMLAAMITIRHRPASATERRPARHARAAPNRLVALPSGERHASAGGVPGPLSAEPPMARAARRLRQAEAGWLATALRDDGDA
ncbi:MAG: hypothetical protein R3184_15620 [Aurantimonas coralicida]|nr:hypothetical protein [Aurantimonas coralicida]